MIHAARWKQRYAVLWVEVRHRLEGTRLGVKVGSVVEAPPFLPPCGLRPLQLDGMVWSKGTSKRFVTRRRLTAETTVGRVQRQKATHKV